MIDPSTTAFTAAEINSAEPVIPDFKIVILAIYKEDDFPKRVLADIHGKPLIQYVYECAKRSKANEIVIVTASPRVGMIAEDFGATVCIIVDEELTGVALLSEVVDKMAWDDETIVVNFPADAPFTPRSILQQVISNLVTHETAEYALLYSYVSLEVAEKENSITLVADKDHRVMYLSHYPIVFQHDPSQSDQFRYKCNIGIRAIRVSLLRTCKKLLKLDVDSIEKIDELTLLYNGISIHAEEAGSLIGQRVLIESDVDKVKLQIAPPR